MMMHIYMHATLWPKSACFTVALLCRLLLCMCSGSPFSAAPNIRFQLQGASGSYVKTGLDPQEDQLKSGMLPTDPHFGLEQEKNGILYDGHNKNAVTTKKGSYAEYFAKLANAIENNEEPPVTVYEAADVIRIIELAGKSSQLEEKVLLK